MGYMNFQSSILEKVFKRFKWTRNNTIELFNAAVHANSLNFTPEQSSKNHTFQSILFQFQCIVTTTDTYLRKLTGQGNTKFGVLIIENKEIAKKDIDGDSVKKYLKTQLEDLEVLLKKYDANKAEEELDTILKIVNHEYLHQGELILMFRRAGVEFPERFKKAWAL